jgi:hypothetical protein
MAMAGGTDCDAGIEIEKPVPVDILDNGALSASRYQRITARIRGRENGAIAFNDRTGARTRQLGGNLRKIRTKQFRALHMNSPAVSEVEGLPQGAAGLNAEGVTSVGTEEGGSRCGWHWHHLNCTAARAVQQ